MWNSSAIVWELSVKITAPHLFVQACVCQCVKGLCTGWDEIFHCHRTSEAWLAGAGPSRCSATPRGWAPHLPTHNSTHTHTTMIISSHCQGGISCWPPAMVAQYQVYVQEQPLTATGWTLSSWRKPVRPHPPSFFFFFNTVQGWSHVWEGSNNGNRELLLLWVTYTQGSRFDFTKMKL